jgi:hypothetical protein
LNGARDQGRAATAVFHIVWKPFGFDVFQRFVSSYVANAAEHDHQLILLFKGFEAPQQSNPYANLVSNVAHRSIFVEDRGFDIGSYLAAAHLVSADYYCFLNSKSEILGEGWLRKLFSLACSDDVGIVGATGSWESLYTDHLNSGIARRADASYLRNVISKSMFNRLRHLYFYAPFPNAHIRSNAFMLRRETLAKLKVGRMRTRRDTSRFENGRANITRQILNMNMRAVVVGRNGEAYEPAQWPESKTFWSADQQNLLVADNQTTRYQNANPAERGAMRRQAWGTA